MGEKAKEINLSWLGKCRQCGKCCTYNINWLNFNNEEEKQNAIEWAEARGHKIIQISNNLIQANYPSKCPHLKNNLCELHENKPKWCQWYPHNMHISAKQYNLDINLILTPECGFKWTED